MNKVEARARAKSLWGVGGCARDYRNGKYRVGLLTPMSPVAAPKFLVFGEGSSWEEAFENSMIEGSEGQLRASRIESGDLTQKASQLFTSRIEDDTFRY